MVLPIGKTIFVFLSELSELGGVIDQEFHLPKLPVEDAVKVLQELGFDIFKGSGLTNSLEQSVIIIQVNGLSPPSCW
ncbi:hypothetical protein MHI43_02385 [Paenibacillus sp. FSL H8-0457]|uniref:hypothetical protein n=1 Tax=Paenibacillus sp. FSL H8-0457 TaxID=2921386 RepID=UPI0003E28E68|nr:hypothetical protein C172_23938 [Paenibacillus sp. FSL H8-457]